MLIDSNMYSSKFDKLSFLCLFFYFNQATLQQKKKTGRKLEFAKTDVAPKDT